MSNLDTSISTGKPVELYLFTTNTKVLAVTNAGAFVTHAGHTFKPVLVRRSEIELSENAFKSPVQITLPKTEQFAADYIKYTYNDAVSLTVFRGDLTQGGFEVFWKGLVVSGRSDGFSVTLEGKSKYEQLRTQGLRDKITRSCGRSLFDDQCGVLKDDYEVSAQIFSVSGVTVTFSTLVQPDQYFRAGFLETADGEEKFIIDHVGQVITLKEPLQSLKAGQTVSLYPGCDLRYETCDTKFGNTVNYRGRRHLAPHSPFDGRSIV